jgi:hypothetical protein
MRKELRRYLAQVYRRDILGESVGVEMPQVDAGLLDEIKGEIKRIDDMRFGALLANRDFGLYQRRRALGRLLQQIEEYQKQPAPVVAEETHAPDGKGL